MIWALHGAVGRSADWSAFALSMRQDLDLYPDLSSTVGEVRRIDLWRFLDCCPMSLEKFGSTLAGEISRIDPEPILVAYSMGGRLALHALLAQPKMWKGAVIISAHPGLSDESQKVARRQQDAEWSALALKGEWADFLEQWNAQGVLVGDADMPDRLALKTRRASVARSFVDWSLGAQQNLTERFQEIECPVLWLTGENDTKFTDLAKESVSLIPDAEHGILPNCGHRVPWEQPEAFSAICQNFFFSRLHLRP
jgi:2-succinyl-6-hydroxy-2,4-cyclohexadiene-1-carboxylate synthase